jgi:hypothetical protein
MWLLKLHLAFSILCILTFVGFSTVFKETIKNNGYAISENKKQITAYLMFFVPLLNILAVIVLLVMISVKKEDLDELIKD